MVENNLLNNIKKHRITIVDTNEQYDCLTQQHLLQGLKSLGKKGIPSGCHGGGCGVCKIHILSGKVKKVKMSRQHISEQDEANGIVLACCAFPESAVSLKVVGKLSRKVTQSKNNNI